MAVIEWTDPPFTAGHWVPDLVTAAGGRPVAACPQAAVPEPTSLGPDRGRGAGGGRGGPVRVRPRRRRRPRRSWSLVELPGLPVWAIDADGLVVRPGPRLVDGVEALAAILHADAGITAPDGHIRRIA